MSGPVLITMVPTRVFDFFHIDVKPREDKFKLWTKFDKCGIFTIEMVHERIMKDLFDKDWHC